MMEKTHFHFFLDLCGKQVFYKYFLMYRHHPHHNPTFITQSLRYIYTTSNLVLYIIDTMSSLEIEIY